MAGFNWAKAAKKILSEPNLYKLPSPNPQDKGPQIGYQMIDQYGGRTDVIQIVIQNPELIEQAVEFQRGGRWLYKYLTSVKQPGRAGTCMKQLGQSDLLRLLQAEYSPLRAMVMRYMGRAPKPAEPDQRKR